jgi:hypothetical protein
MRLLTRAYLRSVRGQLALLGLTFAGALGLAAAALCLRDRLFERWARESYPPLDGNVKDAALELAGMGWDGWRGITYLKDKLDEAPSGAEAVYGALIEDSELDPDGWLTGAIFFLRADYLLERMKRTLVAGDAAQRAGVLRVLGQAYGKLQPSLASRKVTFEQSLELVRFARRRAARRGEEALVRQADTVLEQLSPAGHGRPIPPGAGS